MAEAVKGRPGPESLKARCAGALERLLVSGELAAGDRLPPERELAARLGVSRPVLHGAAVELAAKGFLEIEPRHGLRVRDFWREGSLSTFEAIVLGSGADFPPGVLEDVLRFRALVELEAASLAARRRGGEYLEPLERHLEEEASLPSPPAGLERRADLDLRFHRLLVDASGDRVLPLVMGSIAPIAAALIERFYRAGPDVARVAGLHRGIVAAVGRGRPAEARRLAAALLEEGASLIAGPSAEGGRRPGRG